MEEPAKPVSKSGKVELWHSYDAAERWIDVLEHFLEDVIVARQRVFQLNLTHHISATIYLSICTAN